MMCTWSLSLVLRNLPHCAEMLLVFNILSHKASDILKSRWKILTDIEVVDKSMVTRFSSLNITIRHSNSVSGSRHKICTGSKYTKIDNTIAIPMLYLSGKKRRLSPLLFVQ